MSKKYFIYKVCIKNNKEIYIEKYDDRHNSLGQPSGKFCYQKKQQSIKSILEVAKENKLNRTHSCQLGELLFSSLFDPVLSQDFINFYVKVVQQEQKLLRIELDIDEKEMPEIAALPWEFLRLPANLNQGTVWLATDPNLAFSRRKALWNPARSIQLAPGEKLRIGLAIAAPTDLGTVEYAEVQEYLEELAEEQSEKIELLPIVNPATPIKIGDLLEHKPHIFHFIGHGRFRGEEGEEVGEIALVKKVRNKVKWVNAEDFAEYFNRHRPGIVVLQACEGGTQSESEAFTGVAAKIVAENIPVVVAMQYEISNAIASLFSYEFYKRLGRGEAVDIAVQNGRRAIALETQYKQRDFATPVVFMRVQDGYLFKQKEDESMQLESSNKTNKLAENITYINDSNVGQIGNNYYNTTPHNELDKNSFSGIIEWINKTSGYIETLNCNQGKKVWDAINDIKEIKSKSLYFTDFEIEVLDLVFYYCHYFSRNRKLHLLKNYSFKNKKDLCDYVKKLVISGNNIRAASTKLSSVVRDTEISELVRQLESN